MRALAFALVLFAGPTLVSAQTRPDWSHYPGYYSPGGAGIALPDLDGDGQTEVVLTGGGSDGFSYSRQFLATLEHQVSRYATTDIRSIGSTWSFAGNVQLVSGTPGNPDSVVVALRELNTGEAVLVTYSGKPLRETARVVIPTEFSLRQIADIDGDGQLEALGCLCGRFASEAPAVLLDYMTGAVEWTDANPAYHMAAGQLDEDPALEIVLGTSYSSAPGRILDGASRAPQWSYPDGFRGTPVFGNFRGSPDAREFMIVEPWGVSRIFVSQPIFSPVAEITTGEVGAHAVHDVNGDGYQDLVVGQGQWGSMVAWSTVNGQTLFSWPNNDHGVSAVAVGNLDGQAGLELVFGTGLSHSGRDVVKVMDVGTGVLRHESADEGGPHSTLVQTDIEGDGPGELVFVTQSSNSNYSGGNLVVLDAETGIERRRRPSAFSSGFWGGPGHLLLAIDIDGDGVREIIGAAGGIVSAVDGISLNDRWRVSNLPEVVHAMATMQLNGDAVDDIVLALSNRLVILDGRNGAELYRSVSFTSQNQARLAIGNADADPQLEVALSLGPTVYIIDPTLGLVESFLSSSAAIQGMQFESSGGLCTLVLTLSDRLDRRACGSGVSLSTRMLGMAATMVRFASDSTGDLIVSDGQRVHRIQGSTVMASTANIDLDLGHRNLAVVTPTGSDHLVYIGGETGVHRITLPPETSLFGSGFEAP